MSSPLSYMAVLQIACPGAPYRAGPCMQGGMTDERVPKEAVVEVTVTVGSALGGEAQPTKRLFSSVDAARRELHLTNTLLCTLHLGTPCLRV